MIEPFFLTQAVWYQSMYTSFLNGLHTILLLPPNVSTCASGSPPPLPHAEYSLCQPPPPTLGKLSRISAKADQFLVRGSLVLQETDSSVQETEFSVQDVY